MKVSVFFNLLDRCWNIMQIKFNVFGFSVDLVYFFIFDIVAFLLIFTILDLFHR